MEQGSLRFTVDAWKASILSETEKSILELKSELRQRKVASFKRIATLCRFSPATQGKVLEELSQKEPSLMKDLFKSLTVPERQAVFHTLGAVHQARILQAMPTLTELLNPQSTEKVPLLKAHNSAVSSVDESCSTGEFDPHQLEAIIYVPFDDTKKSYSGMMVFPQSKQAMNWVVIDTHKDQAGRSRIVLFEVESFSSDESLILRGRDKKKYTLKDSEFINAFGGLLTPQQARRIGYTFYVNTEHHTPVIEHYDDVLSGKLPDRLVLRQERLF